MFNLKEKTPLDQVRIIGDNHHTKISSSDHAEWGLGFEESVRGQDTAENQKKPAIKNRFRVRIYNVY